MATDALSNLRDSFDWFYSILDGTTIPVDVGRQVDGTGPLIAMPEQTIHKNGSQTRPPLGLMPPAWFLLSIGAILLLWWLAPVVVIVPSPWNLSGAALIALGVGIAVIADQQFKRHGTSVKPFQKSSALVSGGVFAFSRNPMYLGMVITLLGITVATGALTPLVIPVGFAVFLHVAFIRHEEQDMLAQFGEEYLSYKKRVRQWL